MNDYHILRTSHWTCSLPVDWKQATSERDGSLYIEAADGSKGVFIATWQLGSQDARSAEEIALAFQDADIRSFEAMAGYRWQTLGKDSWSAGSDRIAVAELWAADQHYRAISKVLAAPPVVVRATFHDYACTDPKASQEYLDPLVSSLLLLEDSGTA